MRLCFLSILLAFLPAGMTAAQVTPVRDTTRFSCTIRSDRDIYSSKTKILFAVNIWNNTSQPQILAAAVDGSTDSMRCPLMSFTVQRIRQHGAKKLIKPDLTIRCGNSDGMTESDFVKLMPGEALDPCSKSRYDDMSIWFPYTHLKPGEYEVYYTYSTQPTEKIRWHWASDLADEPPVTDKQRRLQELIAQVPAVQLRSNTVRLTITR